MTDVRTVTGVVDSAELGLVLPHEHLHNDASSAYRESTDPVVAQLLSGPVRVADAWLLRENPYASRANCGVHDVDAVLDELRLFAEQGGRTIIDLTPPGIGRSPNRLVEFSEKSGVRVIMGSGWYLEPTHPAAVEQLTVEALAQTLVDEFAHPDRVCPGVIGEIGVSPRFTAAEAKALRAACLAQRQVNVPLFVHLPGWKRLAHQVLDIVLTEMSVAPSSVVLCHMDPSGADRDYQMSVADRGVHLEFDMIGMPYDFPDEGQSPHPADTAAAITGLVGRGYADQLLLSHDMFLESMLRKYGGNGLTYVPLAFSARLVRAGVGLDVIASMMRDNPRSLFESAAKG